MKDSKHCVGCEDNFYNGRNDYGIQKCWNLKSARLITRKMVPSDQPPPWHQPMQKLPSCYRRKGYAIFNGNPKGWSG